MVATTEQAVTKIKNILPPKALSSGKIANSNIHTFVAEQGADAVMKRDTNLLRHDLEKRFEISFAVATAPADGTTIHGQSSASTNKSNTTSTSNGNSSAAAATTTRDPYDDDFVNADSDEPANGGTKSRRRGHVPAANHDSMIETEFDSDDEDFFDASNADVQRIFSFLSNATTKELVAIDGIRAKNADIIIAGRPFESWPQCLEFLEKSFPRMTVSDVANSIKNFLNSRTIVWKVIRQCRTWGIRMERALQEIDAPGGLLLQPARMSTGKMKMKQYQLKGFTWMVKIRENGTNGILADEMGLGKTCQSIAFIVHDLALQQQRDSRIKNQYPFLIVVPSSTIDNWVDEFRNWAPHVRICRYHGSANDRAEIAARIFVTWNQFAKREFDVILTTYNTSVASQLDRSLFKRIKFHAAFFDEGHLLKNMTTKRYQQLMTVQADCRILLTGTPIQNSLLELLSVLAFAVPQVFQSGEVEAFQNAFTLISKAFGDSIKTSSEASSITQEATTSQAQPQATTNASLYEQRNIREARQILKPFILRRTKEDVLRDLPSKTDVRVNCPLTRRQRELYDHIVEEARRVRKATSTGEMNITLLMNLRKASNHPLLMRNIYNDAVLERVAADLIKYHPQCRASEHRYVVEDLAVMNDYEIQRYLTSSGSAICTQKMQPYLYDPAELYNSGKFEQLDELMPKLQAENHRILIFSQFVMMLDILQEYMQAKSIKFRRMDGQTPIDERQKMILEYNNDASILIFLLSTRTAGLGINLTGADTVIIHDIDFNPYNDRQAENRVHRVGQLRDVTVYKLISGKTVEERMMDIAKQKEHLEQQVVLSLKNAAAHTNGNNSGASSSQAIVVSDDDDNDEPVGGLKKRKASSATTSRGGKKNRINSEDAGDAESGMAAISLDGEIVENGDIPAVSQAVVEELLGDIINLEPAAATSA